MLERDGDEVCVLAGWPGALEDAWRTGLEDEAARAQSALYSRDRALFAYRQDPNEIGGRRLEKAAQEHAVARDAYCDARDGKGETTSQEVG